MNDSNSFPKLKIEIEARLLDELSPFIVYLQISNVTVKPSGKDQINELRRVISLIKSKYSNSPNSLLNDRIIRAYREFYWRIKIDPTKQRPAAEALIRRVLRQGNIPLINNVVDSGNMASLLTGIPIGLYDINKIKEKTLILKFSNVGDKFVSIGGKEIILKGEPSLYDGKRVLHLYPHRDSELTKITFDTKNVLVMSCGVPGVKISEITRAAELTRDYILKYAGGSSSPFYKVGTA